jgi:hypothetical protein
VIILQHRIDALKDRQRRLGRRLIGKRAKILVLRVIVAEQRERLLAGPIHAALVIAGGTQPHFVLCGAQRDRERSVVER